MITSGARAIREVLAAALADDPSVRLLGDDVGRAGGVAGTTAGLLELGGEDRVLDLPIAERAAAAFAVGLALSGLRPVLHLSSTGRLVAVLEALGAAGSAVGHGFRAPLVVRVPYGDEAPGLDAAVGGWLDALPGVTVACGSSPGQLAGLLREGLRRDHPVVLLEPRALYAERAGIPAGPAALAPRLLVGGPGAPAPGRITLAAWGTGVPAALEAASQLDAEGIAAEVLDLVVLAPLDAAALGASVRRTGRLLVVGPHDPALAGRVQRAAAEEAFLHLESPLAHAGPRVDAVTRAATESVRY